MCIDAPNQVKTVLVEWTANGHEVCFQITKIIARNVKLPKLCIKYI